MSLGMLRLYYLYSFSPRTLYGGCHLDPKAMRPLWPLTQPPIGGKILKRRFDFAGCSVEMPGHITWMADDASAEWHAQFYSFRWLRDIASSKKQREVGSFSREFINGFILEGDDQSAISWEPDIAGTRLALWMEHLELILEGSSRIFRQRFSRAIIRHALFLKRYLETNPAHPRALPAIWALTAVAHRFKPMRFLRAIACDKLNAWLAANIREDGMIKSGKPYDQMSALQTLIDLHTILPNNALIYADLAKHIMRMGTMLAFCCHGDGRLALFGGTTLQDATLIARLIERAHAHGTVPLMATGGLCRLQRDTSRLFLMTGYGGNGRTAFSGPLSMEFSYGTERIVVNCGAYLGNDPLWTNAMKSPAAHSTLSLDGDVPQTPENHRRPAPRLESLEKPEGPMLRATVEAAPGIIHSRTVIMAEDGGKIAGRDQITCQFKDPSGIEATIRFHLHPDIRCQKAADGRIALTTVSGQSWYFRSAEPHTASIEESVFMGYKGKPQRTLQLVLQPKLIEGMSEVSWAFEVKDRD